MRGKKEENLERDERNPSDEQIKPKKKPQTKEKVMMLLRKRNVRKREGQHEVGELQ